MKEIRNEPTEKKEYKGIGMEGILAKWYARTTKKDKNRFAEVLKDVAENTPDGGHILEVAPGPGYLSIELAKLNRFRMTALDISYSFVEIARKNAEKEGVKVDFRQGNVSKMPFEDNMFDFIVCTAAFKNFSEPVKAIHEIYRVLKPGKKALIEDMRHDASPSDINSEVNRMDLEGLDAFFTKLVLRFLLRRAYTETQFRAIIAQSSFTKFEIQKSPIGFKIWLEK